MRRRLIALLLQTALLLTGVLVPGGVLANDPGDDGSLQTASGRVLPPLPDELRQPSVHAEMLAQQGSGSFDFQPGGEPTLLLDRSGTVTSAPGVRDEDAAEPDGSAGTLTQPLTTSGLPNGLRKEVLGFLPYWMLTDSALAEMNYSLVSTIAYFSVGANRNGDLVKGTSSSPSIGWAGWTSSRMTEVLDRAHANGVRVVLTVTMMAWDSTSTANMEAFLTSAAARSRLVGQIVDAVRARGADGVNLDFEPVPSTLRSQYTAFVKQVKEGLTDAGVGSYLTVCVMAGAATWATGYDVAGLTAAGAADHLFVMGYDYHWSGSSRAGGVAPIDSPYTIDVDGTMRDFLAETTGAKIIWGVPYYGRSWRTTTNQLNSPTISGGSAAYYYTGALSQARQYGRRWDDVGKVPWYRYWNAAAGNWVQGYYDDRESLGVKYDLVNARGFAGTGMWTLLMDAGEEHLWRLLADKFVTDRAPPVGGIRLLPSTVDGQSVKVSWRVVDYASGIDRYNVQVRKVGYAWSTWLSGTRHTSAWFAGDADAYYEFRVQGIDRKGNAQAWVSVPSRPASVRAGAFARVATSSLNVRSGAGTGYAIVATAARGDAMYVLEGPVSAGGYQWYRVQYGFTEWPSADYPLIGWAASGSGAEAYLAPAMSPTVTRLEPFVRGISATRAFSPNGDGLQDVATVSFRLTGAASAVRLEVVNASGSVVRRIDLGSRSSGVHSATWDGRLGSGAVAGQGTYLPRIVATSPDGTHVGPAATVTSELLRRYGMTVDLTAPRITARDPAPGSSLVASSRRVVISFNEPMRYLGAASIRIRVADGPWLAARNRVENGRRRVVIIPDQPLPTATRIRVQISRKARDMAGNRLGATSWAFTTAPGTAYQPARRLTVEPGTHTAYVIGGDGVLSSPRRLTFSSRSGAHVGHRAKLPNLPGRWLYVNTGGFAGRWLRESGLDHLSGQSERAAYASSTRIVVRAGQHIGYRFDSAGRVTGTRSYRLGSTSGANVDGRAIINGLPYLSVINGVWAGYWLPESAAVHRRGAIERLAFPARPRLALAAGTYTGYRYDSGGRVVSRVTASISRASGANAAAWAVINGRPHFLVANGIWADTWLPETSGVEMDA